MQKPISGICFDLFNTLVNVATVPVEIGAFTADILGVSRDRWRETCFGPEHEICRPVEAFDNIRRLAHAIDPSISHERLVAATEARQRRFDYALHNVDEEVLLGLQQLRDMPLKLALVSNASSSEVSAWESSPLAGLFDVVVFSCDCGSQKPEMDIYLHASRHLQLQPEQCLFVGDGGSREHLGAHAVGMRPVLLGRHLREKELVERRALYTDVLQSEVRDLDELCRNIQCVV